MLCTGLTIVHIHLESHDASPGLPEHPGQFPGTPSCLQSCKPTLHLKGKKGREGGRRWDGGRRREREKGRREEGRREEGERQRGEKEGRRGGHGTHTRNVVN